jgi:hypothetical protein
MGSQCKKSDYYHSYPYPYHIHIHLHLDPGSYRYGELSWLCCPTTKVSRKRNSVETFSLTIDSLCAKTKPIWITQ